MSDERLAEIRAREQGVPPAPWRSEDDARTLERWILSEDGTLEIGLGYVGNRTEDVAAFIVHARQDIPDLLNEIIRLRKQEQGVREVIVGAYAREKRLLEWAEDIKSEERKTGVQAVAFEAQTIAARLQRVLRGEVAS